MSELDRYNQDIYNLIDEFVKREVLPETIAEQAKTVYRDFISQHYAWSRPKEHFAIACVYHAIRSEHLPYTLRGLVGENDIRNPSKTFRQICSETGNFPPLQEPEVFIDRIHTQLGVDDLTATRAKEIIKNQPEAALSGKQPNTIAAGAYYLAAQQTRHRKTQASISEVANVSSLTIRKRYTELANGAQ